MRERREAKTEGVQEDSCGWLCLYGSLSSLCVCGGGFQTVHKDLVIKVSCVSIGSVVVIV